MDEPEKTKTTREQLLEARAQISELRKQIDEVAPVFMDAGDGMSYLNKLCPFCRTKTSSRHSMEHAAWCPWLKNHEAMQHAETEPQAGLDVSVLQHAEAVREAYFSGHGAMALFSARKMPADVKMDIDFDVAAADEESWARSSTRRRLMLTLIESGLDEGQAKLAADGEEQGLKLGPALIYKIPSSRNPDQENPNE